jgi:hypothetical protein
VTLEESRRGRRAPAAQPDRHRRPLGITRPGAAQLAAIDLEAHAVPIVAPREVVECRIEQGLEMAANDLFDISRVDQRGQLVAQRQPHRGAARVGEAGRRNPLPGRAMPRREMPSRRDRRGPPPGLGDHVGRDEESELDPDAREPDAFAASLAARGHVVVSGQLPPLHAAAIVDDRQGRFRGIGEQADAGRARVERVGHDFGEDRLLERAGVGRRAGLRAGAEDRPGSHPRPLLIV